MKKQLPESFSYFSYETSKMVGIVNDTAMEISAMVMLSPVK